MRRFVLVASRGASAPGFPLDDLPGTAGRMDVVARCVRAALFVSHGVRRDAEISVVLNGPPQPGRIVRFRGEGLRSLNPDERSVARAVAQALEERPLDAAVHGLREVRPGVSAGAGGLEALLELARAAEGVRDLVVLEPGAGPWSPEEAPLGDPARLFVLGDDRGIAREERALLEGAGARAVGLGSAERHVDDCIAVMHYLADEAAAASASGARASR